MTVFHVSGSSGSGKSTLGNMLKLIYPDRVLHIIDLDHLFRTALEHSHDPQTDSIQRYVTGAITRAKKKYPNILLVGYSDLIMGGEVQYFDLNADVKYFIEIPIEQLLRQYRRRASEHVLHTRREIQTMSDDDIRKMAATDRRLYRGYTHLPQLQILKDIILRLKR